MSRMLSTVSKREMPWRRSSSDSSSRTRPGGLRAEGHRRAVEAAEGAVAHRPPPAAARGLQRQPRPHGGGEGGAAEAAEVVVEIGHRQRVEILEDRLRRLAQGEPAVAARRAVDAGRQLRRRDLPPLGEQAAAEAGDQRVGLAGDHVVDPREAAVDGPPHHPLAVGAAEQGDHRGVELADAAEQGERGGLLLEGGGAADDAGAGGQHPLGRAVDEAGRRLPQRPQVARPAARPPRRPGGSRAPGCGRRRSVRRYSSSPARGALAEGGGGERPLPRQEVLGELGRQGGTEGARPPRRTRGWRYSTAVAIPSRSSTALSSPRASEGRFSEAYGMLTRQTPGRGCARLEVGYVVSGISRELSAAGGAKGDEK